jgi:hypothetical protein
MEWSGTEWRGIHKKRIEKKNGMEWNEPTASHETRAYGHKDTRARGLQ